MSERIKYTDEPLGEPKVVPDFLPDPEGLVFRDEGFKDAHDRAEQAPPDADG